MEKNEINKYLFIKYVDDVNMYVESIKKGNRWVGGRKGKIEYREEWVEEDSEKSDGEVTMEIIKNLSMSVSTWMEFTVDYEENHKDGHVPMLDICVWKAGPNKIHQGFYEKPMTTGLVMQVKSAAPHS